MKKFLSIFLFLAVSGFASDTLSTVGVVAMSEKNRLDSSEIAFHFAVVNRSDTVLHIPFLRYIARSDDSAAVEFIVDSSSVPVDLKMKSGKMQISRYEDALLTLGYHPFNRPTVYVDTVIFHLLESVQPGNSAEIFCRYRRKDGSALVDSNDHSEQYHEGVWEPNYFMTVRNASDERVLFGWDDSDIQSDAVLFNNEIKNGWKVKNLAISKYNGESDTIPPGRFVLFLKRSESLSEEEVEKMAERNALYYSRYIPISRDTAYNSIHLWGDILPFLPDFPKAEFQHFLFHADSAMAKSSLDSLFPDFFNAQSIELNWKILYLSNIVYWSYGRNFLGGVDILDESASTVLSWPEEVRDSAGELEMSVNCWMDVSDDSCVQIIEECGGRLIDVEEEFHLPLLENPNYDGEYDEKHAEFYCTIEEDVWPVGLFARVPAQNWSCLLQHSDVFYLAPLNVCDIDVVLYGIEKSKKKVFSRVRNSVSHKVNGAVSKGIHSGIVIENGRAKVRLGR